MIRFEEHLIGNRIQYFIYEDGTKIGEAWFKVRSYDTTIVISNIDISKTRQGIGTELITILMNRYPNYRFRGENPNKASVEWHKHLESEFGDRMIPFTEEEIEHALKYE